MNVKEGQTKIKRILCIDGGGIKGTLPAAFLKTLEEDLSGSIGNYFDLIAGTSTGGILALGIAMGHEAKELLALYEERGPAIFGQETLEKADQDWILAKIKKLNAYCRHWIKPKHDADVLERELKAVLKDARIGDARTRLILPAWNPDQRKPYIYKTAHHSRFTTDYRKTALDAALSTTAAPTYFKQHCTADSIGLFDGSIWANNPTAIAVVEAIAILGWCPSEIRVLSLGCSEEIYTLPENPGISKMIPQALGLFIDAQSQGALGMAKILLQHPHGGKRLYRYSPQVPQGTFSLDEPKQITRLKGLGTSTARYAKPYLSEVFFQEPAEAFYPKHHHRESKT